MLKYPCLVLDHDDTVVQSEATINYPYFCYILDQFRPGATITKEEYFHGCFHIGFSEMCRQKYQFTQQELIEEYQGWQAYIKTHIPAPYPGIGDLIRRYKASGGILCVVSHSAKENITRDYMTHFGILPDVIYGWDFPEHQRKPNPFPLENIMDKYGFDPHELLVVDDMKPAWDMAHPLGVPVAFAKWGKLECPELCQIMESICDYTFDSPAALEQFLF